MTSHAALVSREWGKPCVVGFGQMQLSAKEAAFSIGSTGSLEEGNWITIDGSVGEVYAGRGEIEPHSWRLQPELQGLAQIIDFGIKGDDVSPIAVGRVWRIRDFFVYRTPLQRVATSKQPTESKAFVSLFHRDSVLLMPQETLSPRLLAKMNRTTAF